MKRLIYISLLLMLSLISGSCTSNNGKVGLWFGTWKLESIKIDGETDPDYAGNILWKFQSDIIEMVITGKYHEVDRRWGTWEETENKNLILNFTYYQETEEGKEYYHFTPLEETHLPYGSSTLKIETMNAAKMTLRYISEDGVSYLYTLTKWG